MLIDHPAFTAGTLPSSFGLLSMPSTLSWPNEIADPRPTNGFGDNFVPFLEEMRASGANVLAESGWSLFEFSRNDRSIHFVRRGRSQELDGVSRANPDMYWEAIPVQKGVAHRLGPLFGIREHACVVVCGVPDIRLITIRWLNGDSIAATVRGISLWDRLAPSSPLQGIA